ncbi:MAG: acyltransferase family protein [Leptothrix sp. (in: b-proteobacteria)]
MVSLHDSMTQASTASGAKAHESTATEPHRADIEGLRGVAVLAVLAVHAFPGALTGGYVGVDVFFVLSGYLISSQVDRDLAAGRFSLIDFYSRRIRRLLPALCTVLASCLVIGALATWPSDARQIGKHVGAGALFASNVALWLEAGYFDASSELKPLLHLWSLGIEEQFYLLWPLAAWWLQEQRRRHGDARAMIWLGAALLGSLALNLACIASKPSATFFLLPTRAWELLVGVALAGLERQGNAPLPALRARLVNLTRMPWHQQNSGPAFCAGAGLALIALAMLALDRHDRYPGSWALLPTLGTAAVLAAGKDNGVSRHLLGHRAPRFFGSISYPLYLWHWPLLVFPPLLGLELTWSMRAGLLGASVVLATVTMELIETPLRRKRPGTHTSIALVAALALIGAAGAALQKSDGLLQRHPRAIRDIASIEFGFDYGSYRAGRCMLDLEKGPEAFAAECAGISSAGVAARPDVMIWGDSHAASLYPGLVTLRNARGRSLAIGQYTKARCPPLLSPPGGSSQACASTNAAIVERIGAARPKAVVLGGHWQQYDAAALRDLRLSIAALRATGIERIAVMGQIPTWNRPVPRLLLQGWKDAHEIPVRSTSAQRAVAQLADAQIREAIAGSGATFVSAWDTLCTQQGCLLSVQGPHGAKPLAFDESHLTQEGSRLLVERVNWEGLID